MDSMRERCSRTEDVRFTLVEGDGVVLVEGDGEVLVELVGNDKLVNDNDGAALLADVDAKGGIPRIARRLVIVLPAVCCCSTKSMTARTWLMWSAQVSGHFTSNTRSSLE
jgi:hypothetical protein